MAYQNSSIFAKRWYLVFDKRQKKERHELMKIFQPGDKVRYKRGMSSVSCDGVIAIVVGVHPVTAESTVIYYDNQFFPVITNWLELAPEPIRVEGWVNVYADTHREIFYHKIIADTAARDRASKRIACVYVNGIEGVEASDVKN